MAVGVCTDESPDLLQDFFSHFPLPSSFRHPWSAFPLLPEEISYRAIIKDFESEKNVPRKGMPRHTLL
jgi:hypothetical protein